MKLNADGTTVAFDSLQTFEIGMIEGCDAGSLLVEDELSPYFNNITQPIYFVADSNITENDTVLIRVGVIDNGGGGGSASRPVKINSKEKELLTLKKNKTPQQKPLGENTATYCFLGEIDWPNMGDGFVVVGEPIEILLGETKYYGVKKKEENGVVKEIKIVEIETDYGVEPFFPASAGEGWQWITQSSVWPTEPVTKTEGEKVGVYWEKEKPVWNGNVKKGNLPIGLIRLIGRYWEEGKTYKVKLTAHTQNGETASIEIEVKKPKKLHNSKSGLKKEMTKYKDIDGSEKNIDEICIKNAGIYGIPPQFLKGQMFGEAAKNTSIGVFYPSYRYEPYTTQWDKYLKFWSGKFYFKDKVSADFSDVPNHSNIKYMSYWSVAKTVWEIIDENSQLTNKNNSSHYGKRKDDNTMDFDKDNFPWLQKKYDEILELEKKRKELELEKQVDSANVKMAKWLKEKWHDGKANTEVAQTRCASSYGLLQMLYTTARGEKGYSSIEVPEKLNDLSLLEHWVEYQSDLLGTKITENNWYNGFEEDFKTSVFKKWNKASSYPGKIFSNSKKFLPQ